MERVSLCNPVCCLTPDNKSHGRSAPSLRACGQGDARQPSTDARTVTGAPETSRAFRGWGGWAEERDGRGDVTRGGDGAVPRGITITVVWETALFCVPPPLFHKKEKL